jgi:hypothetical protein
MRETGPVHKKLASGGERYVSLARTLLGALKKRMALNGLKEGVDRKVLPDGTKITVKHIGGQDIVEINPARREEEKQTKYPVVCIGSTLYNKQNNYMAFRQSYIWGIDDKGEIKGFPVPFTIGSYYWASVEGIILSWYAPLTTQYEDAPLGYLVSRSYGSPSYDNFYHQYGSIIEYVYRRDQQSKIYGPVLGLGLTTQKDLLVVGFDNPSGGSRYVCFSVYEIDLHTTKDGFVDLASHKIISHVYVGTDVPQSAVMNSAGTLILINFTNFSEAYEIQYEELTGTYKIKKVKKELFSSEIVQDFIGMSSKVIRVQAGSTSNTPSPNKSISEKCSWVCHPGEPGCTSINGWVKYEAHVTTITNGSSSGKIQLSNSKKIEVNGFSTSRKDEDLYGEGEPSSTGNLCANTNPGVTYFEEKGSWDASNVWACFNLQFGPAIFTHLYHHVGNKSKSSNDPTGVENVTYSNKYQFSINMPKYLYTIANTTETRSGAYGDSGSISVVQVGFIYDSWSVISYVGNEVKHTYFITSAINPLYFGGDVINPPPSFYTSAIANKKGIGYFRSKWFIPLESLFDMPNIDVDNYALNYHTLVEYGEYLVKYLPENVSVKVT